MRALRAAIEAADAAAPPEVLLRMTTEIEVERHVADWLEEGPLEPAGWAVDEAIRTAVATPRGRNRTYGSRTMRWIWAAAAVVAAVIAVAVIRPFSTTGPGAVSSSSPTPSVAPSPSAAAAPAADRLLDRDCPGQRDRRATGPLDAELQQRGAAVPQPGRRVVRSANHVRRRRVHARRRRLPQRTGEGHYRWAVAYGALSLTLISDPSVCRSDDPRVIAVRRRTTLNSREVGHGPGRSP